MNEARDIPEHPLVRETIRDCLTEAMDVEGLIRLLERIERRGVRCLAVETPMPSPFSHEILNANPYAYLDDAPLEERRARAVEMRRSLPPELAGKIGALSADAIAEVAEEAWPVVRDADELHDALLTLVWVPCDHPLVQANGWARHVPELAQAGRAVMVRQQPAQAETIIAGWCATECRAQVQAVFPGFAFDPSAPEASPEDREEAVRRIVQGWMESTGPTTVSELAQVLHLDDGSVQKALLQMESSGQVLRGQFRPVAQASRHEPDVEYCDRRLLARIHRLTIGRLRKEIEPVTAAEFMRFLFQWQHVTPGARLHGENGVLEVIRQLSGFEAAASAWERYLLPVRLGKYDPALLDRLTLSGSVAWARLSPHPALIPGSQSDAPDAARIRRIVPTSVAPISLFPREEADWLMQLFRPGDAGGIPLSPVAQELHRYLQQRGASFFSDLVKGTGHLPGQVEEGLWELAAAGLVTADWFDNLRALIDPRRRRPEGRDRSGAQRMTSRARHGAGRWSLIRGNAPTASPGTLPVEQAARQMLMRYGVVFRDLLGRESFQDSGLAWRDLLIQYRRMEFQGEIRGGRFVSGFVGEQFALPEALEAVRAIRKSGTSGQEIRISAADPLNLVGVILPRPRVPSVPGNYIVFRDGVPLRTGTVRDIPPSDARIRLAAPEG